MPKQPSENQVIEARTRFDHLIEILSEPRKTQVKNMMEKMTEYYVAPASSQLDFHSCFPGGLMMHSLNVVNNLNKLAKTLCPGKYKDETLIFVGLFHDLGKAGDGDEPMYSPNPSEWHREKLGQMYTINKDLQYMPNSERGLYVLQKFGIQVTPEEYLAIRLNDGMYDDTNKNYRMREPQLALLLHWADRYSCEQEK